MNRTIRTFKEWLSHGEPEILYKSNIYEDATSIEKRKVKSLLKKLEDILKQHNFSLSFDVFRDGSINKAIGIFPKRLFITSPHAPFSSLSSITITVFLNLLSFILSVAIRK